MAAFTPVPSRPPLRLQRTVPLGLLRAATAVSGAGLQLARLVRVVAAPSADPQVVHPPTPGHFLADARQADATLQRMVAQLARFDRSQRQRRWFLTLYTRMTRGTIDAIDAGVFDDPAWIRALMSHFSDYYFTALGNLQAGRPERMPRPWRIAFAAADHGRPAGVLLPAMLGMSAHINYDLGLTTADLLLTEATVTGDPVVAVARRRQADFDRINDVIGSIVGDALAIFAAEGADILADVDREILGRQELADRWTTSVALWRTDAWQAAGRAACVDRPGRSPVMARPAVEAQLTVAAGNWSQVLRGLGWASTTRLGPRAVTWFLDDPVGTTRWVRTANRACLPIPG